MGDDIDLQRPADRPVAAVVVETPLAHLDRLFEYAVPEDLAADAVPGARVRVRFSGRDLDGFVVERRVRAEHSGRLAPIRRVVSPEPVLTPEVLTLSRAVAERYAGTLSDVLRLAVPRRHATAERNLPREPPSSESVPPPAPGLAAGPWAAYPAGPAWLRRMADGEGPAAAWQALPGRRPDGDWPAAFATAAATALAAGRGSVLVVPDHRDVERLETALVAVVGKGKHVRLTADQGPQARYTAWLKVLRGHVRIVMGTRAAAFAPVHDLGLVGWWDDGDDLLSEPRAPYHHVGVVLQLRAALTGAALLAGGFGRSLRVQLGVESGLLVPVEPSPSALREAMPRVTIAGEGADEERDGPAARAHIPSRAWRIAKDGLVDGPVLLQVPRRGYLPALSCAQCRMPVRCARCQGPVALGAAGAAPTCRWCALAVAGGHFECVHCGSHRLRSAVTGARRTAEEIGRAFPGVPIHTSGSGEVLATVGAAPSLVISTPGAEPVADGGYSAVVLLDAWAMLDLPVLDAPIEAARRWMAAAALAREGRAVVLCGAPEAIALPAVEALVRWDPAWLAARELADRRELGLPPAARIAQLTGSRRALEEALTQVNLPPTAQVLGPLPFSPGLGGSRPSGGERSSGVSLGMRAAGAGAADAGAAGTSGGGAGAAGARRGGAGAAGARRGGAGAAGTGGVGPAGPAAGAEGAAERPSADHQVLVRVPVGDTAALTRALVALKAFRSARKASEVVVVRVDPLDMW